MEHSLHPQASTKEQDLFSIRQSGCPFFYVITKGQVTPAQRSRTERELDVTYWLRWLLCDNPRIDCLCRLIQWLPDRLGEPETGNTTKGFVL